MFQDILRQCSASLKSLAFQDCPIQLDAATQHTFTPVVLPALQAIEIADFASSRAILSTLTLFTAPNVTRLGLSTLLWGEDGAWTEFDDALDAISTLR